MTRVKITKDYDMYRAGQVVDVTPNEAHGLIDRGKAMLSKDMAPKEVTTKVVEKKTARVKKVKKAKK